MAGIIPLKAAGMARYMNENVPGIAVPQDMIDKLAAAAAEGKEKGVKGLPMQHGIEMAAEMIAKIKDEHLCDGVHIMAIGAEKERPGHPRKGRRYDLSFLSYISASNRPNGLPEFRYKTII